MSEYDAFHYRKSDFVDEIKVDFVPDAAGGPKFVIPLSGGDSLSFGLDTLRTLRYELDTAESLYYEKFPHEVAWDNIPASIRSGLMMPPAVREFMEENTGTDTPS